MSEHSTTEVLVGAAVLATAVGFFVFAAQSTGSLPQTGDSYTLNASFRTADGVAVGTDVRLAGVKVGSVASIALDPETYRAETVLSVRGGIDIPDDSSAAISSEGLLGGNFVEILPGGSPFPMEPGTEFFDTQSSVSLTTLLLRFVSGQGE